MHFCFKVPPSQPDPPSEVERIAFDDDSVHLMWKPGFDGGFNQTFDLQAKKRICVKVNFESESNVSLTKNVAGLWHIWRESGP